MDHAGRRKLTLVVSLVALVVVSTCVVLLAKDRIVREWLLWQLASAEEAEQVRIAARLAETQDPRVVAALLRLDFSRWESEFVHDAGALHDLLDDQTRPVEACSPAVFGLRALGPAAIEPLIEEFRRVVDELETQTGPLPVRSTQLAFFRILAGLLGIPEARESLFQLWNTSPDGLERFMAAWVLGLMEHPQTFDEKLLLIAESPEADRLPTELLERLESMK